jgi:hypothetical protein
MVITTPSTTKNQNLGSSRLSAPTTDVSGSAAHSPTQQQIRERAYQIHDSDKGEWRSATVNWLQAERELIAEHGHTNEHR